MSKIVETTRAFVGDFVTFGCELLYILQSVGFHIWMLLEHDVFGSVMFMYNVYLLRARGGPP